jgi:hypothetical protein
MVARAEIGAEELVRSGAIEVSTVARTRIPRPSGYHHAYCEEVRVTAAIPMRASLRRQLTWWALVFPAIMIVALAAHNLRLLNWIHVLSGALWTGADIFLGFIVGPVMRLLDGPQRTAVISFLVPRTLLYFPCVSLTTGTCGWFLASWLGMTVPGNPQFPWIIAALVLITLMTILGLGIMTPNAVRIWLELRKAEPDRSLITSLNRNNIINAAVQGVMQMAIVIVMAHLTLG